MKLVDNLSKHEIVSSYNSISAEKKSRRSIMVPNSIIFEEQVINYNHVDKYILVEVTTGLTYKSNLEQAERLVISAVENVMK